MSRHCLHCPLPDVLKGPDVLARGCDGPVRAVEGGSHIVDMRHEVQYTEPDTTHPAGETFCGREYAPGIRIRGQTWVELEAISRYDEIKGLLRESNGLLPGVYDVISTSVRGSSRSELHTMAEKIGLGMQAVEGAIAEEEKCLDNLTSFLTANPFSNPQGLTPETFIRFEQHVASKIGTHRLHEATMGGVNQQLQGEIDTMSTAIALLGDAHDRAEFRTALMASLIEDVASHELELSKTASGASAGFAHLGASLLKDSFLILTTTEI